MSVPTVPTLVVYTYPSFLGGCVGSGPFPPACDAVIGAFERAHHVDVELEVPGGTLVSSLVAEEGAPRADVVIGLDEITGPQAIAAGVLQPYTPPGLAGVPADLVADLGGGGYVTPYEYGYLALDSNGSIGPSGPSFQNWSFPAIASNRSFASSLMIEDPLTDITGEEFLLWEIAFYESVLHENWQDFWQSADPYLRVAPDWDTAWTDFTTSPGNPPMVVSYSTDPAYAVANGGPSFSSSAGEWNGTSYAWRTTYGAGVVRGTAHLALAEDLVAWLLNGTVQAEFPPNEYEYPVNASAPLPASFAAAIPPDTLVPLNDAIPPAERAAELPGYLDAWQNLANEYG